MNLFQNRSNNSGRSAEIKAWTTEILALDEETTVMVTELACSEPGCPPLETIVAVLRPGEQRQVKFHKPMAELTREELQARLPQAFLSATSLSDQKSSFNPN